MSALQGHRLGPGLTDRMIDLMGSLPVAPASEDLPRALSGHLWLLTAADGDGIRLTKAGYLPPAVVGEVVLHVPTMMGWLHRVTREENSRPLLQFRQHLIRVGLLRSSRGVLASTVAGRKCAEDPTKLWSHLVSRFLPAKPPYTHLVSALIVLHLATSEGKINTDAIADTMTALGWSQEGRRPIDSDVVYWDYNRVWSGIGNIGWQKDPSTFNRTLTPEGKAFAFDVLFSEAPNPDIDAPVA